MKTLIALLFPILCLAQVGIGTTTPQNDFHVNGGVRIDSVTENATASRFLVLNANNDINWNDGSSLVTTPNIVVVNDEPGTNYLIPISTVGAFTIAQSLIIQTVNIQANSVAKINVNYNVPVSIDSGNTNVNTRVLVNFYLDGVLLPSKGNRHQLPNTGNAETYIYGSHRLIVINNTNNPITRTFEIEGVIEQVSSGGPDTVYEFEDTLYLSYEMVGYN